MKEKHLYKDICKLNMHACNLTFSMLNRSFIIDVISNMIVIVQPVIKLTWQLHSKNIKVKVKTQIYTPANGIWAKKVRAGMREKCWHHGTTNERHHSFCGGNKNQSYLCVMCWVLSFKTGDKILFNEHRGSNQYKFSNLSWENSNNA